MGFKYDLAVGNKAEAMVQLIFGSNGITSDINTDRNEKYDIKAVLPDKRIFTAEVKFDLYCARSGNIAIEFYNPKQGKHSGVMATLADCWIHIITSPMSVWLTSVKSLKNYIATSPAYKTVACGGDDNSSMYLYKKDIIFGAIFQRIDECNSVDLHGIIDKILGE